MTAKFRETVMLKSDGKVTLFDREGNTLANLIETDSLLGRIVSLLQENEQRIEANPYSEVVVKIQDRKPVMLEITSKHKPR